MGSEVGLLIVGFVLTTVVGGALGTWFQRRTWDHQHEAQLYEQELERASETCYSISVLLDRRLYRMVRLERAISGFDDGGFSRQDVADRMQMYDDVLFEWNDALNGHLAVIATYFGEPGRRFLDNEIYEHFAAAGRCLERDFRNVMNGGSVDAHDCGLEHLNGLVYRLVSYMTSHVRDGTVGSRLKDVMPAPDAP